MTVEQIRANFRVAHGKQLQVVADANFAQLDAAATLKKERANLKALEQQFNADIQNADVPSEPELPFSTGKDGKK